MQPSRTGEERMWHEVAASRRRDTSPAGKGCETDPEDISTDLENAYEPPAVARGVVGRRRRRRRPVTEDAVVATLRLAREVEELRRHRDELMALHYAQVLNTSRRDNALNTTLEYFDTFRSGFTGRHIPEMLRFFNTRLETNVFAYGGGNLGLDTWIEQWRRYTLIYPGISMRLRSMAHQQLLDSPDQLAVAETDPAMTASIVETQGTLDGTLSRQAILTVLPHLRHREDLVQKLLGKQLSIPMTLRFYFNGAGRVHRYDFEGDYFQALSNIEGVSLMDLAQITEHVALGDNTTVPDVVEVEEE